MFSGCIALKLITSTGLWRRWRLARRRGEPPSVFSHDQLRPSSQPIGAWHGQGRKAGWWSPLLLALYDPETGGFQAVCKWCADCYFLRAVILRQERSISGFTDQFYKVRALAPR